MEMMQDQLKMYSIQTNDEVQIQTYDDLREVYGFEYNMVELVISTEKPKGSLYSELQSDRVELEKICDLYTSFFPKCPPKPVHKIEGPLSRIFRCLHTTLKFDKNCDKLFSNSSGKLLMYEFLFSPSEPEFDLVISTTGNPIWCGIVDVESSIRGVADIFALSNDMTVIGEVKGTSGTQVGAMCQVLAEVHSIKKEGRWPIGTVVYT